MAKDRGISHRGAGDPALQVERSLDGPVGRRGDQVGRMELRLSNGEKMVRPSAARSKGCALGCEP